MNIFILVRNCVGGFDIIKTSSNYSTTKTLMEKYGGYRGLSSLINSRAKEINYHAGPVTVHGVFTNKADAEVEKKHELKRLGIIKNFRSKREKNAKW